jgi:hypothetical protein
MSRPCSIPAARKSVPVSTRSMSLRPAPCIAFSLPGNSGAGAFVKLTLPTSFGFLLAKFWIASWVSARSPATSTTLIVTGLCAAAPVAPNVKSAAVASAAAVNVCAVRRRPCDCTLLAFIYVLR